MITRPICLDCSRHYTQECPKVNFKEKTPLSSMYGHDLSHLCKGDTDIVPFFLTVDSESGLPTVVECNMFDDQTREEEKPLPLPKEEPEKKPFKDPLNLIKMARSQEEPTFTLRAKDALSIEVLDCYIEALQENNITGPILDGAKKIYGEFNAWQDNNPDKVRLPD